MITKGKTLDILSYLKLSYKFSQLVIILFCNPLRVISIKFLLVISMLCINNRVVMRIMDMVTQDEFA